MACCAAGCGHRSGSGCHFYNFPSPNDGPDWKKWHDLWVLRINRVNLDGSPWRPDTAHTKLCSCHFRPEDQWDPKSRKGGLKCKEPVYFDHQPIPASSPPGHLQQASNGVCIDTISEECGLKRPWFVASSHNAPVESNLRPASKRKTLQSHPGRKQKGISLFRSPRMPRLKVKDYFERQYEAASLTHESSTTGSSTSQPTPSKQQYFNPNVELPSTQCSTSTSNNKQEDTGNQQVMMDPDVCEVIEVIDSDDSSQDISSHSYLIHQEGVKNEEVDTSDDFVPIARVICSQQTTSPVNVKLETNDSHLSDDGFLGYDGEVTPQIVSVNPLSVDVNQDQIHDQQLSELAQFVRKECHDDTQKESPEVVLPSNKTPRAKISNVKPIRVVSCKSLASDTNFHLDASSQASVSREEAVNVNKDNSSETMYREMFNKLMTPGSRFPQDVVQTGTSLETEVDIVNMLCDHQRPPEKADMKLTQAVDRIKELEKALCEQRFGLHRYYGSDEKIMFYTGFRSADTLMRFFWRIEPDDLTSERSNKWQDAQTFATETLHLCGSSGDFSGKVIPYMDELFLFLCHVWLGLPPKDLVERFALPNTDCAQFIILRWIYYLKATLPGTLEGTKSNSTPSNSVRFQGQYRNTKLFLHRMEIKVQQKSVMNHLSSLKLHGLVGFSPSGEVTFSSDVASVVTSNSDLLKVSGVLTLLEPGDGVLAEGDIAMDSLSSMGITAHCLPSLDFPHDPTYLQLGSSSRDSHKCHTEVARLLSAKYVDSLSGFRCFHSVVVFPFAHCVRDLWEVCCRLVNYQRGHRSL
ncbi:uncharacterized protein LOC119721278 [Patiria miniata]|uniref:THAP-type domain-containing protein n=1 Tax=Patiria miniata TaxID=46514 RepID=A0A913Z651_PATMI|nr:uncharacterized protein LOC119721278 [Patiria miniata]